MSKSDTVGDSPEVTEPVRVKEQAEQTDVYDILSKVPSRKYTVEDRLDVVMRWISCGNLKRVSKETGFPYMTLVEWKLESDWWPEVVAECRKRKQEELDGTLTGIIHDITGEIADRVRNGDEKYDAKTGAHFRLKMQGKELATVAGILFDKRAAMRGDPTTISKQTTSAEQLQALESKFKEFSQVLQNSGNLAKPIEGETNGN